MNRSCAILSLFPSLVKARQGDSTLRLLSRALAPVGSFPSWIFFHSAMRPTPELFMLVQSHPQANNHTITTTTIAIGILVMRRRTN